MGKYVPGLGALTGILESTWQSEFLEVQIQIIRKRLGLDKLIPLGPKLQEKILSKHLK